MQRTVFAGIAAMAAMTSVAAVRFENDLQEQQYVEVDTGIDTGIDTEIGTEVDAEVDNELDTEIDIEGEGEPYITQQCKDIFRSVDGVDNWIQLDLLLSGKKKNPWQMDNPLKDNDKLANRFLASQKPCRD